MFEIEFNLDYIIQYDVYPIFPYIIAFMCSVEIIIQKIEMMEITSWTQIKWTTNNAEIQEAALFYGNLRSGKS